MSVSCIITAIRSTDLDLIRGALEDCASSASSLAVYSSFASLNADKELRTFTDRRASRPFSLLELLYEQDRGTTTNQCAITNIYNNTFQSTQNHNLFASDTTLNRNDPYESLLRR